MIKPLGNKVAVKVQQSESISEGGIHLASEIKERVGRGEVVAAGPGSVSSKGVKIPMQVKVGDKVLVDTAVGATIKVDGEDLLMIQETDILGII
jgi:chaperonin GroES